MDTVGTAVTLYMHTQVLDGFVDQPSEERLSDLLNGVFLPQPERRGRFLELRDMGIPHADGTKDSLPTTYINKATIQMAAVSDSDSARGIGGKAGSKYPPYVRKLPVRVSLRLPDYALTGSMHRVGGEDIQHVLEEKLLFLPLTNVTIRALESNIESTAPFVAINREQIFSFQEEKVAQDSSNLPEAS